MTPEDAEQAIRNYLIALDDPAKLKDQERLDALDKQIEAEEDVLEQMKLEAERHRLTAASPADYEADFVANIKEWAETNKVPVDVLKQRKVSDDVLRKAGMLGGRTRRRSRGTTVSWETVKEHARVREGLFTKQDLAEATGASSVTVNKALDELLKAEKVVKRPAPQEAEDKPGRTPTFYEAVNGPE